NATLEERTGHDDVFIARLLGSVGEISERSYNQIDTARLQVEIVLFGGLVFADVDIVLEVFVEQRQAQRSGLNADGTALDFSRYVIDCLLRGSFILGEIKGFAGMRQLGVWAV